MAVGDQAASNSSPADDALLAYRDASTARLQNMLELIEENAARPPLEERLKAANRIPEPPRPSAAAADQAMSQIRDLGGIGAGPTALRLASRDYQDGSTRGA